MKRILMTGATGFVGREVLRRLLDEGEDVLTVGRTAPEAGTAFLRCGIEDGAALSEALRGKEFDSIVHFASLPGDTGDPREMVRTNVNGFQNVLEVARTSPGARVLLASSISAYEWYPATAFHPADYLPVDEEHPCRPKDMYAVTKRMQELLLETYRCQYGLRTAALRLTAVVGPQGRGGGRSWRTFAEQLSEGEEVELPHFTPHETCHYVDIRDVAAMVLAVLRKDEVTGETFNCCGPRRTTGAEFEAAVKALYPALRVKYGYPWSMAQGNTLYFDMGKARRVLGFAPRYGIADSVRSIKEWIDAGGLKERAEARRFGGGMAEPSQG